MVRRRKITIGEKKLRKIRGPKRPQKKKRLYNLNDNNICWRVFLLVPLSMATSFFSLDHFYDICVKIMLYDYPRLLAHIPFILKCTQKPSC
jgi:hypothetical protein